MKRAIVKFTLLAFAVCFCCNIICFYASRPSREAIEEAYRFCQNNGYNTDVFAIADYSRYSGSARFWIYDYKNKEIVSRSLCPHGCGKGNTMLTPKFSNAAGSCCTSLGKYRISGKREHEALGTCLELDGLESSNSNARKRGILVHRSILSNIFYFGSMPFPLPLTKASEGCFSLNTACLDKLIAATEHSSKPILLYALTE